VSTQYKFVGESSAIKREMEELTAKAVVLEESIDMIESDWKGKPMDKATLDVVTTLGLERADILRKLESLQRQQRQIELEKERKTRNRIISKTLRAVTSRSTEAPAAPLPDSISNSEELENEVAAAQAAASSSASTPALDTDDAGDDSDDKSSASTRSRSSRHQRSSTKSSRRHSNQVDASAISADADSHSPKLVRHRVRRSAASTHAYTASTADAAAAPAADADGKAAASARAAQRPVARTSDEEASRPKRTQSTSAAAPGSAQTLKSGVAPSIVDRLRAAAAAKELEKKKKLQSADADAPEGFRLDETE